MSHSCSSLHTSSNPISWQIFLKHRSSVAPPLRCIQCTAQCPSDGMSLLVWLNFVDLRASNTSRVSRDWLVIKGFHNSRVDRLRLKTIRVPLWCWTQRLGLNVDVGVPKNGVGLEFGCVYVPKESTNVEPRWDATPKDRPTQLRMKKSGSQKTNLGLTLRMQWVCQKINWGLKQLDY